jgi:acyl dehydratase
MIGTYAKAAAALVPGAGRLPWVAGGGGELPALTREHADVEIDRGHVAAYSRVCGFGLHDALPPTYPHMIAFPMHMDLMTDGRFPFGAVGLVHIANRIVGHRPLRITDVLTMRVRTGDLREHPKGRAFSILSEARVGDEVVWEEDSTFLHRGGGSGSREERADRPEPPFVAEWRLPGDLGRRYGAVSGDRNPIHLHPLSARLFGFPRAIAHGMWTKARCLAALRLPESLEVEVEFRKPILLPGTVSFHAADGRFAVRSGDRVHLTGELR